MLHASTALTWAVHIDKYAYYHSFFLTGKITMFSRCSNTGVFLYISVSLCPRDIFHLVRFQISTEQSDKKKENTNWSYNARTAEQTVNKRLHLSDGACYSWLESTPRVSTRVSLMRALHADWLTGTLCRGLEELKLVCRFRVQPDWQQLESTGYVRVCSCRATPLTASLGPLMRAWAWCIWVVKGFGI